MPIDPASALILYNGRSSQARELADKLATQLGSKFPLYSTGTGENLFPFPSPSAVVTVGGDGTILHAVRHAAPLNIPLLGVNMGRLGFLTEIESIDSERLVPEYLADAEHREVFRKMLQAELDMSDGKSWPVVHALNDVVVGRGSMAHIMRIQVSIDGAVLTTYGTDAVIAATSTGSTGYSLSAGGPILSPESSDTVLAAVASHGDLSSALVLPNGSIISLKVQGEHSATFTADGYTNISLEPGDRVHISNSPHRAIFLRAGSLQRFYETLVYRLRRGADQALSLSKAIVEEEVRRRG